MLRKKRGYFFGCTVAHNFVVNFLRFKLCLLFAENTHDRGKFHYMTDVLLDCFGYDQTSRNNVHKQCNWIQKINSLALQWYFPLSKYFLLWTWSSLPSGRRSGDVDTHLSNGQTNWDIVLQGLSQSFWHFINTTTYKLGAAKWFKGKTLMNYVLPGLGYPWLEKPWFGYPWPGNVCLVWIWSDVSGRRSFSSLKSSSLASTGISIASDSSWPRPSRPKMTSDWFRFWSNPLGLFSDPRLIHRIPRTDTDAAAKIRNGNTNFIFKSISCKIWQSWTSISSPPSSRTTTTLMRSRWSTEPYSRNESNSNRVNRDWPLTLPRTVTTVVVVWKNKQSYRLHHFTLLT